MSFDSKKYGEGTRYKLDEVNPAETPWTIIVRPLPFGYSVELSNETKIPKAANTTPERP